MDGVISLHEIRGVYTQYAASIVEYCKVNIIRYYFLCGGDLMINEKNKSIVDFFHKVREFDVESSFDERLSLLGKLHELSNRFDMDNYFKSNAYGDLSGELFIDLFFLNHALKIYNFVQGPFYQLLLIMSCVSHSISDTDLKSRCENFCKSLVERVRSVCQGSAITQGEAKALEVIVATLRACVLGCQDQDIGPNIHKDSIVTKVLELEEIYNGTNKNIQQRILRLLEVIDGMSEGMDNLLQLPRASKGIFDYKYLEILQSCSKALDSCKYGDAVNADVRWLYNISAFKNHTSDVDVLRKNHTSDVDVLRKMYTQAYYSRKFYSLLSHLVMSVIVNSYPTFSQMSNGGQRPPSSHSSFLAAQQRNMLLSVFLPLPALLVYGYLLREGGFTLGLDAIDDGMLRYCWSEVRLFVERIRSEWGSAKSWEEDLAAGYMVNLRRAGMDITSLLPKQPNKTMTADSLQQFLDVLKHVQGFVLEQSIMEPPLLATLGVVMYVLGFVSDDYWNTASEFIYPASPVAVRLTMSTFFILGVWLLSAIKEAVFFMSRDKNEFMPVIALARLTALGSNLVLGAMIANPVLMGMLYIWDKTLGGLHDSAMHLPINKLYEEAWELNGVLPGILFFLAAVFLLKICLSAVLFYAKAGISFFSALRNFKPDSDLNFSDLLQQFQPLIITLFSVCILSLALAPFCINEHSGYTYLPIVASSLSFLVAVGMILGISKLGGWISFMHSFFNAVLQFSADSLYGPYFALTDFPYQLQLTAAVYLAGTGSGRGKKPGIIPVCGLFILLQAIGTLEICRMSNNKMPVVIYWLYMSLKPLSLYCYRSASGTRFLEDEVAAANTAKLQRTHYLLILAEVLRLLAEVLRQVLTKYPCCFASLLAFLNKHLGLGDEQGEPLINSDEGASQLSQDVVSATAYSHASGALYRPVSHGRSDQGSNEFVRDPSIRGESFGDFFGDHRPTLGDSIHEQAKMYYKCKPQQLGDLLSHVRKSDEMSVVPVQL